MGAGSSQEYYEPQPIRPSLPSRQPAPANGRGVKRRRRRIFQRARPAPTTVMPSPVRHHSPHRQHHPHHPQHRPRHLAPPPMPVFAQVPPAAPSSMPIAYHNYTALPYMSPQSMMFSPQQMQPMLMPQQMPQSYQMMAASSRPLTIQRYPPMMLQQSLLQQQARMMQPYMSPQQPMMMPQETPQAQAMRMAHQMPASMYSPYVSSPYAMAAPYSTPYVQAQSSQPQQQAQPSAQPMYNNIGASAPAVGGVSGAAGPYSAPIRPAGPNLGTDWTGGGKISPGFLGPPL